MNNERALVYGLLESTSDLRSIFVGTSILRKLWNSGNLSKYFTVSWPSSGTRNKFPFNHIYR